MMIVVEANVKWQLTNQSEFQVLLVPLVENQAQKYLMMAPINAATAAIAGARNNRIYVVVLGLIFFI